MTHWNQSKTEIENNPFGRCVIFFFATVALGTAVFGVGWLMDWLEITKYKVEAYPLFDSTYGGLGYEPSKLMRWFFNAQNGLFIITTLLLGGIELAAIVVFFISGYIIQPTNHICFRAKAGRGY